MNTVEFAVRDGVPYAIDFMNPAPDMDINSLTPHYFDWTVKHMADMAIRLATHKPEPRSPANGEFLLGRREAANGRRAGPKCWRGPAIRATGIDEYHELLTDEVAQESQRQLDEQLRAARLFFGDRPLCTVLRPRFLSPPQYRFLQAARRVVLRAFRKAHRAALANDTVMAQFRLADWERELARVDPGFRDASPVSRLDAFFVAEAGGLALHRVQRRDAGRRRVQRRAHRGVLRAAASCASSCGTGTCARFRRVTTCCTRCSTRMPNGRARAIAPRIAIVDWSDVPTQSEFVLFQDYFERQGLDDCDHRDPRGDGVRRNGLCCSHGAIDLVYKRVLLHELVERGGLDHPIVRAVRERAVCMVNPFRCKLLHKKASLAVLHDERNARCSTPTSRQAIAASIPWTRVVEERHTTHAGHDVDLLPFIAEHREQLVLKPNDEYGGRRASCSAGRWTTRRGSARSRPRSPSRTSCSSGSRSRRSRIRASWMAEWCSPTAWWTPRRTWPTVITSTAA